MIVSATDALPSASGDDGGDGGDHEIASASVLTATARTVGDVVIDPGATVTVVCADWLDAYVAALPEDLRQTVVSEAASVLFRFGDARTTMAGAQWEVAVLLGSDVRRLKTHVVPGGLPLLLSRPALKAARALIGMEDDTIWLKDMGIFLPVYVGKTGHMRVNELPPAVCSALPVVNRSRRVSLAPLPRFHATVPTDTGTARVGGAASAPATATATVDAATPTTVASPTVEPADGDAAAPVFPAALRPRDALEVIKAGPQLAAVIKGLHRTYAHTGADRLLALFREAGCRDAAIAPAVRQVTAACGSCRATRSRPPRSVVTLPRPTLFNDTVAMDLAEVTRRGVFLHIIDLVTRVSRCVVIPEKEAPNVVRALLSCWICFYGACRVMLSDSGREFHNALMCILSERFNIRVNVTSAQSAWSNGICERHSGVIKHMVGALSKDCAEASLQELLEHARFANNFLAVHGCASPFQLSTNSQPRLPSVLSDDLPAMQEGHIPTEAHLARTVAMLAASPAAFSRAEASQSARRALKRRAPGDPGRVYSPGDVVRYWEQAKASDRRGMHGPAKVVSQAGRVVRLFHGGECKTRNASDVELFPAPNPPASPSLDVGVVGAALFALCHAAGPCGAPRRPWRWSKGSRPRVSPPRSPCKCPPR